MSLRASMEFGEYQNTFPGELPEYGAIFMSNNYTKKECFKRKLLGLPMAQAGFVTQIKAGMVLFLLEYEKRELHGVFQAVSDGAINIVPHAYSSTGKQFPAQVKFEQIWRCTPLSENEFRDAIRENYFSRYKFNFGLSERQVRRLLVLFSSRKIKEYPLPRDSTSSKVPTEIERAINKSKNEDDENFVMVGHQESKLQKGERFGMISSRSSADCLGGSTRSQRRLIDNSNSPSAPIGNRYRMDNEEGSAILDKQIGDLFCDVRRSIDDRAVIIEAAGNELNMNIEADDRAVITEAVGNELNMNIEARPIASHEDKIGMDIPSYVPNIPRLLPYVPYLPNLRGGFPSSDLSGSVFRPSFCPSEDVNSDRTNMPFRMPTYPEIEARKLLGHENSWETPLAHQTSQIANKGNKTLPSSNKDHCFLLDDNDITSVNPSIHQNSEMYADCKNRVSVFDRIVLPSKTIKSDDAICARNDECNLDSSVDAIMDVLHQNFYQWMKTKSYKPPTKRINYVKNRGIGRGKILNSKVLNDPEAKASKEKSVAVNDAAAHENSNVPIAEDMHFLDFKRRSKAQNTCDDVRPLVDSADAANDGSSQGNHKRRKLIRPKFNKHESHGDHIVGSLDNGCKPSENVRLPIVMLHTDLQVKNVDVEKTPDGPAEDKMQNGEGKEAMENCRESLRQKDEDRNETLLNFGITDVSSSLYCKVEINDTESLSLENIQVMQGHESIKSTEVDGSVKNDVSDVPCLVSSKYEVNHADDYLSLEITPEKDVKEEPENNNVPIPNVHSSLSYKVEDPNLDKVSSLESSEVGKLVQLRNYACYTILQELSSGLRVGGGSESGLECFGAHNHDVDDT